jgi:hypothetical protein
LRIGILLDSDRQLGACEALTDALIRRGHAVHLAVQGETVKDREGALGRLGAAHMELSVGHAPQRADRFSSFLRDLQGRLEPWRDAEEDEDDAPQGGTLMAQLTAASLPADPDVTAYLEQLDLDLLLLAPRADPWSSRLDYLIACRRLGLGAAVLQAPGASSRLAQLLQLASIPMTPGVGGDDAPLLAAIEQAAQAAAPRRRAGWALRPALELELARRAFRRFAEDRLGADVRHGALLGLLGRALGSVQDAYARWIFPVALRGLLAALPTRRDAYRNLLSEQLDPGEMSRLGWVEDALDEARRGDAPILIGPWTGGVGHEILYWIPMLRWFRKSYNIDKSRIVVISRGGVKDWYTGVLGAYLDMFDLLPLKRQDYRDDALRRVSSSEAPPAAGKIEKEIYKEAARAIGAERFTTLHPQVMFKLFKRRWSGLAGDTFVTRHTRAQPIGAGTSAAEKRLGPLPADYVAVSLWFGDALPDTPENRELATRFILQLSQACDVFLLEPCIDPQSSPMALVGPDPRIHRIDAEIRPSEILAVHSGVIAGARAFVTTSGAMAHLGQALGRTVAAVSAADGRLGAGERELGMIAPDPGAGPIYPVGLDQLDALVPALAGTSDADGPGLAEALAAARLQAPAARARAKAPADALDG